VTNQTSTPTPPDAQRPGSNRFFTWLRSLGITRADGWIGGVCGGIALRTGLDPLIVRGIAVVIAILGGPALFFYAAAWLLLPDTHGEIHLERMLRGIFDAPLIAIGILVVLTFIPITQGAWWLGDRIVGSAWWFAAPAEVLHVLWNLAVIAAIVWFVVWLVSRVRNTPRGERPFGAAAGDGRAAAWTWPNDPAATGRPGAAASQAATTVPAPAAPAAAGTAPGGSEAAPGPETPAEASGRPTEQPPTAPSAPGAGATKDDLSEWRERYAAWREQHEAWQEQQRAQLGSARDVRSAEVRAQSMALAAELERKRLARHAANPRLSGWAVALVLGVALVAGGIAGAVAATDAELARYAAPIGVALALAVIGLGMVVAGAARRRSGALAALAIAALIIGLGSFGWPVHEAPVGFTQLRADRDVTFTQFAGQVEVDAAAADLGAGTREVTIDQTFGAVAVYLGDGIDAQVRVTSTDSRVHPYVRQGDELVRQPSLRVSAPRGATPVERSWETGGSGDPELIVEITQGHGGVYIYQGGERPNSGIYHGDALPSGVLDLRD
jgi:phage shock protein PspC (stress-responsive transcriptional regulator)